MTSASSPAPAPWTPSPAPSSGWDLIPLAEQFDNHDEFRPPATGDLAGRRAELVLQDGAHAEVVLEGPGTLRWTGGESMPWCPAGSAAYEAVPVRNGIYALTVSQLEEGRSALVVVDCPRRRVFANVTEFVPDDDGGGPRERTSVIQAGLGAPLTDPVRPTTDLVGKRLAHRYSTTHVFEHIYLNPNTYAYQGLHGPEAGVADVDRADYWKLGDQLYLFSWHERLQPFNGAAVIDLTARRSTGRLVGWDRVSGSVLQVRTGTRVTVLGQTDYTDI